MPAPAEASGRLRPPSRAYGWTPVLRPKMRQCKNARAVSETALDASVHADGLELLAPGIGAGGLAAVGEHDRRAVCRMQCEQLETGRDLWRLREQDRHVLGADALHVRDLAAAQQCQRFGRDHRFLHGDVVVHVAVHGPRLLSMSTVESWLS